MSIRLLALDLYRLTREVERLEKALDDAQVITLRAQLLF